MPHYVVLYTTTGCSYIILIIVPGGLNHVPIYLLSHYKLNTFVYSAKNVYHKFFVLKKYLRSEHKKRCFILMLRQGLKCIFVIIIIIIVIVHAKCNIIFSTNCIISYVPEPRNSMIHKIIIMRNSN